MVLFHALGSATSSSRQPRFDWQRSEGSQEPQAPNDRVTIGPEPLSERDRALIAELEVRDAEVRAHEAAHQAAGGALVGAASFTYQVGPDHKAYAVGGEVPVSIRAGQTPDETISNARQVRAAALAPAEPSSQDLAVAAAAASLEASAELQRQQLAQSPKLEHRTTHVHQGEPCLTCTRDNKKYESISSAPAPFAAR